MRAKPLSYTSTNPPVGHLPMCVCLEILDLEISGVHLSGDELPEDLGTAEKGSQRSKRPRDIRKKRPGKKLQERLKPSSARST